MADPNETWQSLVVQMQELRETIARQDAQQEHLRATIARQGAQVSALQARLAAVEAPPEPAEQARAVAGPPPTKTSRRQLLQLGGVAAAATVAAGVLAADGGIGTARAAPAHADAATFQQSATGEGNVAIEGDGTNGASGVIGSASTSGTGVAGFGTNGFGVTGIATSGVGVLGQSSTSVGVIGSSDTSLGGIFIGGQAPIHLRPVETTGAPITGFHSQGDIYVDSNATLWVCISSGTPGTWVRLTRVANGTSGGTVNYLAAPVRLLDARSGATSGLINRGPLAAGEIYALTVAGLGGSGIPAGALGLICNVTVLGPSANGNLSLFPTGAAIPTTASMTFLAGAFLANHVSAALGSGGANQGKVNIQNQSGGNTPLVVDAVAFIM